MPDTPYRLQLFEDTAEDTVSEDKRAKLEKSVQEVLKNLWQNWHETASPDLFSRDFVKLLWDKQDTVTSLYQAIFIESDPFFLRAARNAVQYSLERLHQQLKTSPPTIPEDINKVIFALNNVLAIYSMFSPTPHETLHLPQNIDGVWERVEYQITPIELTPQKGLWLPLLDDKDRLFSYGLTPINHPNAHPLLLHKGTGWPTAQGQTIQVLGDLWPNKTPGEIFFDWRYDALKSWIETASSTHNKKVVTLGQSLGGSLAYLSALAFPTQIEKAYALNPPGMAYDYGNQHPYFSEWEKTAKDQRPDVFIQKQNDDIVSKCGVFKPDFHLLKIKVSERNALQKHSLPAMLSAHARSYIHCDDCVVESADMQTENAALHRHKNNKWLYSFGRTLIFYSILAPYFFAIRPIKQFIVRHAFELLIFGSALALFCLFPPASSLLSLAFIPHFGSVFFQALLASIALSQVITAIVNYGHAFLFEQNQKWRDYVDTLRDLDPTIRKGKFLFDIANLMTLGLLKVAVKTLIRVIINPIRYLCFGRTEDALIHTERYHHKTADLNQHPPTSFMTKLQLASFVCLFYLIAVPIKFVFYDAPKFVAHKIKSVLRKRHNNLKSAETESTEASTERTHIISPKTKYHFGRFFSCCARQTSTTEVPRSERSPSLT